MFKLKKERIGDEKLGSGNFGTVFPYQKDPDDLKWVVKRVHADDADAVLKSLEEIVFGFSCDHPCIVPLKGYSIEKGPVKDYYIYLKFPRMKESLKKKFDDQENKKTPFSEQEIVRYFYALVSATEYLHTKKIYHRDIKPDNVLLDYQGNAKLCDVGVAKYVGEDDSRYKVSGMGGAVQYTAPEFYQDKENITKESLRANDVWSVGLVMLELCTLKKKLFNPLTPREEILKIQEKYKKELTEIYSEKLVDFIFELLKVNPIERMKIEDVKRKLGKEYSYCRDLERGSDKHECEILKEDKQKYKRKAEKILDEVKIIKEENFKLQNELKEYQSLIQEFQLQISSFLTKDENKTIEKSKMENQSLVQRVIQKKPDQRNRIVEIELDGLAFGAYGSGMNSFFRRWINNTFEKAEGEEWTNFFGFEKIITQGEGKFSINFPNFKRRGLFCYESRNFDLDFDLGLNCDFYKIVLNFYDITDQKSILNLRKAMDRASLGRFRKSRIIFLVGMKLDLDSERKIPQLDVEEYASSIGAIHIEVSAKTGENFLKFQEELMKAVLAENQPYVKYIEVRKAQEEAKQKQSLF